MIFNKLHPISPSFASFLDKGRHIHYKSAYSVDDWSSLFETCGFTVTSITPYFSPTLVDSIELLDNRDFYPFVSKMYYSLQEHSRSTLKSCWVQYARDMLMSFLADYQYPNLHDTCYIALSCKPSSAS